MDYTYYHKSILRIPFKSIKNGFNKQELHHFFSQAEAKEALYLSSPNLLNKCNDWIKGKIIDNKDEEKIIHSLLKYALRIHNRCTPYGLFASCGVIDNNENIEVNLKKIRRSTRLDMNFTCALAQNLAKKPFIQPHLQLYPNNSIYYLHDEIRYIEYFYKDKRRVHQITTVENSYHLQEIIKKAQKGATINQLSLALIDENITYEEAEAFIKEIIDAQILVSELEPSVTGEELLSQILNVLIIIQRDYPNSDLLHVIDILENIKKSIQKIDSKIGNNITLYEIIEEKIKQLNVPYEKNKLFQTDLFLYNQKNKHKSNNIKPLNFFRLSSSITKALNTLNRLSFYQEHPNLKSFKESFYNRYEEQEVSLAKVLDNETGIGYGVNTNQKGDYSPLIEDVILPENSNNINELIYHKQQSFLFKKLIKAHQNKDKIISIEEEEIIKYEENWNNLPVSISVMYKHIGVQDGKEKFYIEHVGGSSAVNLLGRFGSGNQEIESVIKEIAQQEQIFYGDKVIASILHLPESRTGNILLRPIIREYEIPYLSKSNLPQEQQIPIDDLYVSIRYNQIILRSKKLNKVIIPRLDNAHNYSYKSLPVYNFLCDLQTQNLRETLFFEWGALKNEFSFLPRVEIENVIISLATWQLKKEQYQPLWKTDNLKKETFKWQKKWLLPNLFLLADGDNKLLINIKSELSLKMFVSEIKNRDTIVLEEFLFDEKNPLVKGINGQAYMNEFITILQKNTSKIVSNHYKIKNVENIKIPRFFPLGSEWLYYKIYCGIKTTDRILAKVIKPLAQQLINHQLIDSWFFIRYGDPENHLRIRFHFSDTSQIEKVIHLFYKAIDKYQQSGLIWKIQADTYQREIERYGIKTMVFSEQLFYYDSMCIINFLDQIKNNHLEKLRWLFGIKTVDELLNTFNYSLEQKLALLETLKIGFAQEFNMNKDLRLQLDKKYRAKRTEIETLLWNNKQMNLEYQLVISALKLKKENTSHIAKKILSIYQNKELHSSLNDLLASYIHMSLNRLFKSKQRLHEMIIYDFMWRSYRSEFARKLHYK